MKGGGTDAPEEEEEEEEEPRPSISYDDMWAKTLLDGSDSSVILSHQKSPDMFQFRQFNSDNSMMCCKNFMISTKKFHA
jgi:hypothetical protein